MAQAYSLESAIHQQLALVNSCSLDELAALLPGYSWAQVFAAVDRMTREGTVTLKHPGPVPLPPLARTSSTRRGTPCDAGLNPERAHHRHTSIYL